MLRRPESLGSQKGDVTPTRYVKLLSIMVWCGSAWVTCGCNGDCKRTICCRSVTMFRWF